MALFTRAAAHVQASNMALAPESSSTGSGIATSVLRSLAQQEPAQVARVALLANLTGEPANDVPLLQRFVDDVDTAINATVALQRMVGCVAPGTSGGPAAC